MFRVGLAGCGWIAGYQLQAWRLISEAKVVAACDREIARAQALAAQFDIGWVGDDAVRMMEDCALDIIDIATPPESHKEIALAAMKRGIHVLCQKPAAPNLPDAREMVATADLHNVVLYINEMLRFCPWFRKVRELLAQERIGRPVFARIFNRMPGFLEVGARKTVAYGFRTFLMAQDRVIVLEQTIHYLDVLRYLFGEPCSVYAVTQRVSPMLRGEDLATIVLRYPSMTAVVEDSWAAHGPERSGAEIDGSEGAVFLSHDKALQLHSARTGAIEETWDFSAKSWPEQRPLVFASLFRDFLRVVAGREDPTAQARDNLGTISLTLAAYESARRGVVINL